MIFGIDIGGSKIELAAFDGHFDLIKNWRVTTPVDNYSDFINAIKQLYDVSVSNLGVADKVGVGMAGLIDANGLSLASNLPCVNGKNIENDLSNLLGQSLSVNNDCRLFALSEAYGGAGEGYNNVFGAIVGTGSGGGLTVNGKLYQTRQNIAGEFGHLQLPAVLQQKYDLPVIPCGCGLPSCVDRYIGGLGLLNLAKHFNLDSHSVPSIFQQLRKNCPVAKELIACYLDILGSSFASIILSYDPDVIVLGGGLSLNDELVTGLPQAIRPHLFSQFNAPPIVRAKFGDASGVRGAAVYASQQP